MILNNQMINFHIRLPAKKSRDQRQAADNLSEK